MSLHVLLLCIPYEGELFLGVYSSVAAAEAARDEFISSREHYEEESFEILPVQVDGRAAYYLG